MKQQTSSGSSEDKAKLSLQEYKLLNNETQTIKNLTDESPNLQYPIKSNNEFNSVKEYSEYKNNLSNNPILYCKDKMNKKCLKLFCYIIVGILLFFLFIQMFFMPKYITHILKNSVKDALIFHEIKEHNRNYKHWLSNKGKHGTPIVFSIQLFNVTNPQEVLIGKAPKLKLTPPVKYNTWYNRTNMSFSQDGEWATYSLFEYYTYDSTSQLKEHDKITIVSPLVGFAWQIFKYGGRLERKALHKIVTKLNALVPLFELVFWRGTVYDLIWEEYNITHNNFTFTWGLMYNNSLQYYTTNTGKKTRKRMSEIKSFGKYYSKNNILKPSEYIKCWKDSPPIAPSMLFYYGVNGLHKNKYSIKPLWVDVLYRGLVVEYVKKESYLNVDTFRYTIQVTPQLDNSSIYPSNAQYYQYGPSGVLNITSCYSNVPIFVSLPLFYGAPDYMKNNSLFNLNKPNATNPTYIDVEPYTGAIMNANAGMQINFPLHSLPVNQTNPRRKKNNISLSLLPNDLMIPSYLISFGVNVNNHVARNLGNNIKLAKSLRKTCNIIGYCSIPLIIIYIMYTSYYIGNKERIINKYKRFDEETI